MYINTFFYRIVQFIMNTLVIYAGALKNGSKIEIKNVTIFKSPDWITGVIKKNNIIYKRINVEELLPGVPYTVEIKKYFNLPSLLCNHMIIHQQERWFEYQLEFTLSEGLKHEESKPFVEYSVREY